MILHYKNKQYKLSLCDGFYLTTKDKSNARVESILNTLQESNNIQEWMTMFNTQFYVTLNGVEVDLNKVHNLMLENQFDYIY